LEEVKEKEYFVADKMKKIFENFRNLTSNLRVLG